MSVHQENIPRNPNLPPATAADSKDGTPDLSTLTLSSAAQPNFSASSGPHSRLPLHTATSAPTVTGLRSSAGTTSPQYHMPPSIQVENRAQISSSSPSSPGSYPGLVDPSNILPPTLHSRPVPVRPAPTPAGLQQRRSRPGINLSDLSFPPSVVANTRSPRPPARANASSRESSDRPTLSLKGFPDSTPFSNFSKIVDPMGRLNFDGKAVLHASGVDFSNGSSFEIKMDDLNLMEELGRGNYGTVQKVYHRKSKVTMAMKEIRLELDESKLKGIITELDILHRATAPEIVEFYGAFFIESCVYYCMEYMDAGSLDKLGGGDVPEPVLAQITRSMVRGLKFLKDELQTMHRDVKPTNVLANTQGEIKLCDFGVSGQLERSLAKTNIGCQSYMAPERIKYESQGDTGTYTVASDVWSLGLSIVEFTLGHYPYPPETYTNVFAQLQAIVHGELPTLAEGYSAEAADFVSKCLHRVPEIRPTYAELLEHPFLKQERDVDMAAWVKRRMLQLDSTKID